MKRILSLILVLVLVLGSMPLAFADGHLTDGEKLMELGLLQGDGAGNLMEDEALTRAQMMVMLARLYDVEEEAMAYAVDSPFDDVVEGSYYEPYISYAADVGWTEGVGDGLFEPNTEVGPQMVATFMLRILGYEADWDNAVSQAALLGIMDDNPGGLFTRANAFDMMHDAVYTKMNNDSRTLGQKLGVVEYEEPTVDVDIEVESISASNLKQAVIEFNKAADEDSATSIKNYDVEGDDEDGNDIEIVDASLVDDMTVVITFDVAVKQQSEYDVTVEGVKDVDEDSEVEMDSPITVEALDNTLPTAVDAKVVGIDTIKVTFSEPVQAENKDYFEVNDGDLYIKKVTMSNNDTEANVELYSDLKEGIVTIEALNDIEDYAGFSVMNTTFDVEVVEDTEAPYVVSYKDANRRSVTLVFNEDIEVDGYDADSETPSSGVDFDKNFYHTNTLNEANVLELDGNELTLKFTEDENRLPEGAAYVYIAKEMVNDLWDNENDTTIKTDVEITVDETAPTLVDLDPKYDEDTDEYSIELEFNEEVADVEEDNFTILDEDGDEVEDIIASLKSNEDNDEFVTIVLDDELNGDYTLVIEDVEDLSANAITTISKDFFVEDLKSPKFDKFTATAYNVGTDDQMIKVNFGESMDVSDGKYSVDDLEKYTVNDTVLVDYTDARIRVLKDEKAIEIHMPFDKDEDIDDGNFKLVVKNDPDDGYNLDMMRVADAAGNYTKANSGTLNILESGTIAFSAEAVDVDKVEVTFTDTELAVFESKEFILTENTTGNALNIAGVSTKLNSDGETVAVFTIDEDSDGNLLPVNFTGKVFVDPSIDEDDLETRNGYDEKPYKGLVANIDDSIAPDLATFVYNSDGDTVDNVKSAAGTTYGTITMTFAEPIKSNTLSTNTFDVSGYSVEDYAIDSPTGTVLTLYVLDNDDDPTRAKDGTKIKLVVEIEDAKGNVLDELDTKVTHKNAY